jgi:hypothetical protein
VLYGAQHGPIGADDGIRLGFVVMRMVIDRCAMSFDGLATGLSNAPPSSGLLIAPH